METKVFHCTCKSDYQNEVYGKGNRLFNPKGKGDKVDGYRCTVCGKELRENEGKKK
jgi:CRISPR/Cas system-associated protein Cas10 (large subunit of type III CRISPR-Cas system)